MYRRFFAALFFAVLLTGIAFFQTGNECKVSAAETKAGVGLSEHVLKAYEEGWQYSYGAYGQRSGGTRATDCSGLIKSYLWWTGDSSDPNPSLMSVGGGASAMLNSATESGTIDYSDESSLPRVHGLILYQPGHVGVYVGNNMAVDNRDYGVNIKYEKVFGRSRNKWTMWFKLPQITYPDTGLVEFDGKTYYYQDGEYVVDTTVTVGDTIYTFGSDGALVSTKLTAEAEAEAAAAAGALEAERKAQEEAERIARSKALSAQTEDLIISANFVEPEAETLSETADTSDMVMEDAAREQAAAQAPAAESGMSGAAFGSSVYGLLVLAAAAILILRKTAAQQKKAL